MNTTGLVMTATDELLAELDRSVRVVWHDDDATVIAVDALTAELRRLRAENAELAKDAGRYRWLCDRIEYKGDMVIAKCSEWSIESWSGDDPDTAIDTAMQADK